MVRPCWTFSPVRERTIQSCRRPEQGLTRCRFLPSNFEQTAHSWPRLFLDRWQVWARCEGKESEWLLSGNIKGTSAEPFSGTSTNWRRMKRGNISAHDNGRGCPVPIGQLLNEKGVGCQALGREDLRRYTAAIS